VERVAAKVAGTEVGMEVERAEVERVAAKVAGTEVGTEVEREEVDLDLAMPPTTFSWDEWWRSCEFAKSLTAVAHQAARAGHGPPSSHASGLSDRHDPKRHDALMSMPQ
jgi:hypothetical protein